MVRYMKICSLVETALDATAEATQLQFAASIKGMSAAEVAMEAAAEFVAQNGENNG